MLVGVGETFPVADLGFELPGTELGRGKDATAFDVAPGLVYRKGHELVFVNEDEEIRARIRSHLSDEVIAFDDLPADVQVSRTLIAWVADKRIHKIIERAAGAPLFVGYPPETLIEFATFRRNWELGVAAMADVPQEHFDSVVRDEGELRDRQIYMDYAGAQNLFYDPKVGFTIIDAEFKPAIPSRGKCMYMAFIAAFDLGIVLGRHDNWVGRISPEARDSAIAVIEKLNWAGHQPKKWLLFKKLCEDLDYDP